MNLQVIKHQKLNRKEMPCRQSEYSFTDCLENTIAFKEANCRPFWLWSVWKPTCQNISQLNTFIYWNDWFSHLDYLQLVKESDYSCVRPCTYLEYRVIMKIWIHYHDPHGCLNHKAYFLNCKLFNISNSKC